MDPTPCRVNKGAAPKTKSLSNLGAAYKNSVFFFALILKTWILVKSIGTPS